MLFVFEWGILTNDFEEKTGDGMENVRRRNKLKRSRQRRNRRIITVSAVLGLILGAVMTFFYVFRVTDVKIAGNTRHSDDMIMQYVQEDLLTSNTMLASWFRKSIIVEDIPFVESLDIEALDNNTIRIYVNEKQIVGYIVENDHKLFFDKDGYVLEIMPMTEKELLDIQAEKDKFEQLRREEEGLPPETGNPDEEQNAPEGEEPSEEEDQDGENQDGENQDGENQDGENQDEENLDEENLDGENLDGENVNQTPEGDIPVEEDENDFIVNAPQVPWILGLNNQSMGSDTRIIVENTNVFNTIQGIWNISSNPDYNIVPERVLLDEEYNITLVYQNGTILCQLGTDIILEEKIIRVSAILPTLKDKMGILHLEDYNIGDGIIFSQESEYTIMSKINKFLQKK